MRVEHVRAFVALAEELNFRRAAARLFVSQPTLTAQIHQLERDLGVALFDRGPGGTTGRPRASDCSPSPARHCGARRPRRRGRRLPGARASRRTADGSGSGRSRRGRGPRRGPHCRPSRHGGRTSTWRSRRWPSRPPCRPWTGGGRGPPAPRPGRRGGPAARDDGRVGAGRRAGADAPLAGGSGRASTWTRWCPCSGRCRPADGRGFHPVLAAHGPPAVTHRRGAADVEQTAAWPREAARTGVVGFWPSDIWCLRRPGRSCGRSRSPGWAPLQVVIRQGWHRSDDLVAAASGAVVATEAIVAQDADGVVPPPPDREG